MLRYVSVQVISKLTLIPVTAYKILVLKVPSNQGNFDDSDSDIEELHHVLEESRMQLKVADKSLRKKRKDPLGTGLYLNPGKYVSFMLLFSYKWVTNCYCCLSSREVGRA